MNESLPAGAWDDDRLAAAFVARDRMRPQPDALVVATVDLIAAERRRPNVRVAGSFRPAIALLGLVALVGSLAIARDRSVAVPAISGGPTAAGVSPSTASASPPARTEAPNTALGLPIISVSDAISVRDSGADDRELAVRGWFSPQTVAIFCPFMQRQVQPVQLGCVDRFVWLTEDRESVEREVGGTTELVPPKGPAIHPSFDELGGTWPTFALRLCGTNCQPHPVLIIAIGHFDDRRASLCAATARAQCQDRFVVDRVDSVGGHVQDLSVADTRGANRVWTLDDIERLDPLGPTDGRLSVQVVNGRDKSLDIEPTLATEQYWSRQSAVWVVRDLVGGRLVTRVIADGAHRVYEIGADGTLTIVP
jgi:hypothetical protein